VKVTRKTRASDGTNKTKWFEFGVRALQRTRPDLPKCYVCPLCMRRFPREGLKLLTREHAPPRSIGGREIVLTCSECNSTSGHLLDAELRRRETLLDFARGTMRNRPRTMRNRPRWLSR
jgi:hypothetical protein